MMKEQIIELTEAAKLYPKKSYYKYEIMGILHDTNDPEQAFISPHPESLIEYIQTNYDYEAKAVDLPNSKTEVQLMNEKTVQVPSKYPASTQQVPDNPTTEQSNVVDLAAHKLEWQSHNQKNGLSWNEVAELIDQTVGAVVAKFTKIEESKQKTVNSDCSPKFEENKGVDEKKHFKDCPKCGLKGTYGQLITEQWYCWNCHHKGDS